MVESSNKPVAVSKVDFCKIGLKLKMQIIRILFNPELKGVSK
jgi:hypothetical protein